MKNKLPINSFILFGGILLYGLVFCLLEDGEILTMLAFCAYLAVPAAVILVAEIIGIVIRVKKNKPFADNLSVFVVDLLMELFLIPFAIYDMTAHSGEFFGGLFGFLILIFIVPVPALSLVVNLVQFLVRRKKLKKANTAPESNTSTNN